MIAWLAALCAGIGDAADKLTFAAWHVPPSADLSDGPAPMCGPCNAYIALYEKRRTRDAPHVAFRQMYSRHFIEDAAIWTTIGEQVRHQLERIADEARRALA